MSIRSKLRIRARLRSARYRCWPPKPKPLILTYHRIADEPVDFFRLAVSRACFERQLQVLRRTRQPLALESFVRQFIAGTLPRNAVALTFDDGYVDNLLVAKPCLIQAGIPAMVFLATGYIDRSDAFWWDELAKLVLFATGPQRVELIIARERLTLDLGRAAAPRPDGTLKITLAKERQTTLRQLQQKLRLLDKDERRSAMQELRSKIAQGKCRSELGRAMTRKEVNALITNGLITIGAHTVSHPMLTSIGTAACHREITDSKLACEALIGAPVPGFAYPYGDFDAKTRQAVKSAGFAFACSTQRGPVVSNSDVFALPRIHVANWADSDFEQALHSASTAA